MINSTAFLYDRDENNQHFVAAYEERQNVALRRPPNASPTRTASSSVAKPSIAARGTMAVSPQVAEGQ